MVDRANRSSGGRDADTDPGSGAFRSRRSSSSGLLDDCDLGCTGVSEFEKAVTVDGEETKECNGVPRHWRQRFGNSSLVAMKLTALAQENLATVTIAQFDKAYCVRETSCVPRSLT
jgi:hypothetical protein